MVAVAVAMLIVVKVLVWAAATIGMVVDMLDVLSAVAVDLFMDASTGAMLRVLTGIGIEGLSDVNANASAAVMTALELPVSTPLEGFGR